MKLTDLSIIQDKIRLGLECTTDELETIKVALGNREYQASADGTQTEVGVARNLKRFFSAILEMGKK